MGGTGAQGGNQASKNSHWTHRLFVEHPELYLPFLKQAMDRSVAEVSAVAGLLEHYGVAAPGKVLDVACGIGRHAIPLAQQGYRVTGVDLSPLYVRNARERAEAAGAEARFVAGDIQESAATLGGEAPFDGFINMFTSHGYYGREGDESLFRQLRSLASSGAVLVVLTSHRDWLVRNLDPQGLDVAGSIRILQRRALNLETSSIDSHWQFYEGEGEDLRLRLELSMQHRVYSLHELKALLEDAGWHFEAAFGSDRGPEFELEQLTFDSKTMWVVAKAR